MSLPIDLQLSHLPTLGMMLMLALDQRLARVSCILYLVSGKELSNAVIETLSGVFISPRYNLNFLDQVATNRMPTLLNIRSLKLLQQQFLQMNCTALFLLLWRKRWLETPHIWFPLLLSSSAGTLVAALESAITTFFERHVFSLQLNLCIDMNMMFGLF